MKYSKMLCWVRPHEKKELKKAVNDRFPLIFAKNFNDLISQVKDDSYVIISASRIDSYFEKIRSLQKEFPQNKFHFYAIKEDELFTASQFNLMDEGDSVPGQYVAEELVDNFLGVIPDLWEMRKKEEIPQDLKDALEKNETKNRGIIISKILYLKTLAHFSLRVLRGLPSVSSVVFSFCLFARVRVGSW